MTEITDEQLTIIQAILDSDPSALRDVLRRHLDQAPRPPDHELRARARVWDDETPGHRDLVEVVWEEGRTVDGHALPSWAYYGHALVDGKAGHQIRGLLAAPEGDWQAAVAELHELHPDVPGPGPQWRGLGHGRWQWEHARHSRRMGSARRPRDGPGDTR